MILLGFFRIFQNKRNVRNSENCTNGVKIFLPSSKTDQLRERDTFFISETKTPYCPVYWLQKYLHLTKLKKPKNFLFCRLFKCKVGHSAHGHYKISYMTARESFKDHLSSIIGTDTKQCGLHSLRSRGASEAPNNGVSDRMISKHGCWSSNTSKDKYINDSHSNRFRVSNRLGILTKNFFHPYLVFFSPRVSLQDVSNKRTNLCLFLCIIVML